MNKHLQHILSILQQDEALTAEQKNAITKSLKDADKELEITAFKLDRTEKVKRTTAILLEETIEELEQKRKAVEAQNKELEMEAALEKVRSRSLAMNSSSELNEVVAVLFERLKERNIAVTSVSINIYIEGSRDMDVFVCGQNENVVVVRNYCLPYFDHPIANDLYTAREKRLDLFTGHYSVKEKDSFYEYLFAHSELKQLPDDIKQQIFESTSYSIQAVSASHSMIAINDFEGRLLTESEADILKRFSKTFEQAYVRFLDLQKAEAQAMRAEQDLVAIKAARKKAEDTLVELQATQKQLIQSEKMASLGELTAGIAHEIQNPLNFVNNFSEVSSELIDEMKDELSKGNYEDVNTIADDIKQNLEKINHHGKRADAIVKGMLQHSRSSDGKKEPTDINALCDEYLRLSYHGLRAKEKSFNATLQTDFDEKIGSVNIVPQDIGRVIMNLLTNAFYAVNERAKKEGASYTSTVSIRSRKAGDKVELSVSDNGYGIPPDIVNKIFQPFFTTKPTGQGTGLGLSLVYDIVKAHGGEIKVTTKENEGTEFIIQLPIA